MASRCVSDSCPAKIDATEHSSDQSTSRDLLELHSHDILTCGYVTDDEEAAENPLWAAQGNPDYFPVEICWYAVPHLCLHVPAANDTQSAKDQLWEENRIVDYETEDPCLPEYPPLVFFGSPSGWSTNSTEDWDPCPTPEDYFFRREPRSIWEQQYLMIDPAGGNDLTTGPAAVDEARTRLRESSMQEY